MKEKERLFDALIPVLVIAFGVTVIMVMDKTMGIFLAMDRITVVTILVALVTAFGTIYYAIISTHTFKELRNQGKKNCIIK